jgi:hypothetical protein
MIFDALIILVFWPILVALTAKAGLWQLSCQHYKSSQSGALSIVFDPRIKYVGTKFGIYTFSMLVMAVLIFFWSPLSINMHAGNMTQAGEFIVDAMMTFLKPFSIALAIFLTLQFSHNRYSKTQPLLAPGSASRYVASVATFSMIACWLAPMIEILFISIFPARGNLDTMQDFYRIATAMATVPGSLIGIAVAFDPTQRAYYRAKRLLNKQILAEESLNLLSEEKLHELTELSLVAKNYEAGEILSTHLINRAERHQTADFA